ncbi:hypothetical protein KOW79_001006 [Hemibagrus wyckioides]|uniref:Immunoglobulin domain-containing protein n=2 Tax=Hemibagrus wyckioides TaxID=337641 RepID=A0A9D3PBF3_9TELE|nr:hypothetical protein KOW79_001006 [Hemibagrus wyckioides]
MGMFLLMILITVNLAAPAGSQDAIKLEHVSVQQGKSIIIPCLYKAKYINNQKYLCFGSHFFVCKDVKSLKHRMVSTSDDQTKYIFTVTMKNVTASDAGSYWCSVETAGLDVKDKDFQLKVTTATPDLYVENQTVIGYEGSHVVISCNHQSKSPKAWCKIGGPCVSTSGNISGASVQLRNTDRGFSVTMSKLAMKNTGWYWCSAGNWQMPVHITVQNATSSWERSSFAWLIVLGLLLAVACIAVTVFRQHKQKCEIFSWRERSENTYVSMKKPNPQTKQHTDEEAQDYEIMSSPVQTSGVQGKNREGYESWKTDGGHITDKGHYCTC